MNEDCRGSIGSFMNPSLDKVLGGINAEGNVYTSDVYRWLGRRVPIRECKDIAKKLTEVRDKCQK